MTEIINWNPTRLFTSPRFRFLFAGLFGLAGILSAPTLFDRLDTGLDPAASTEAETTETALRELTGTDGELLAILDTPPLSLATAVAELQGVASSQVIESSTRPGVVLLVAQVDAELDDEGREELLSTFTSIVGEVVPSAFIGGSLALDEELGSTAESDLLRADLITIPIVLLLLGFLLGGFRTALLPFGIIVVVVTGSLAILSAISTITTVSVFAVNIVNLFGVGLAVDYSLMIVSRFREELGAGATVDDAIDKTQQSAGRAVTYSGLTVAVSLSALLVFREPVLRSLAYGGVAATLISVAAARWLLPPMLRRWGNRITPSSRANDRGLIASVAQNVQRRPLVTAAAVTAILFFAAAPLLSIRFEGLDARSLPASSPTRAFLTELSITHPDTPTAPILILADAPAGNPDITTLAADIGSTTGVSPDIVPVGEQTILTVQLLGAATDKTAIDAVQAMRNIDNPTTFGIAGEAAEEADLLASIGDRLPYAAIVLAALTFALLLAFLRAPVIAAKAIVINTLSVGASFGVLVWIAQQGHLAELIGLEPIGALSAVILLLTFAFGFGLSMDYEVFLIARIREHFDETGDNRHATRLGLQQSGRVVTQAAALIIVVFIGFTTGELLLVKQLGLGLALAVAIDATIVRLLLVPALMTVLDDSNWWTPRVLVKDLSANSLS